MTPFTAKEKATYGEVLGPAMKITEPKDAAQYFKAYVEWLCNREPGRTRKQATDIAKKNLGYYAGYYDNETRVRVEELFSCAHPVFGSIADNGPPTPEQAFNA